MTVERCMHPIPEDKGKNTCRVTGRKGKMGELGEQCTDGMLKECKRLWSEQEINSIPVSRIPPFANPETMG